MRIIKNFGNYCYSDETPTGEKLGGFIVYAWSAETQSWTYVTTFSDESRARSYAQSKQRTYEEWMR